MALACPNRPEFIAAYFGILKPGVVVVCISALLRAREIAWQFDHSDAKALIAYDGSDMMIGAACREAFDQVAACRHVWFINSPESLDAGEAIQSFRALMSGQPDNFTTASMRRP